MTGKPVLVVAMLLRVLVCSPLSAQAPTPERVDTVPGLELYSAFWPNLHHRLHADARDQKKRLDPNLLSPEERTRWQAALAYYAADLARRDLRRGEGMTSISEALGTSSSEPPASLAPELRSALRAAAPIYRKYWWPHDDAANRRYIADMAARLRRLTPEVVPRLVAFFGEPWYDTQNPVRVDIVHVGAARGGYTWVDPRVHTVIDAAEPNYQGWLGAEMILHEASHGLTGRVKAAIDVAARSANKDPGLLWHALQFFVVGEIMWRALAAEGETITSYLYATGLFDRAWRGFKPAVEAEVSAYLEGTISRDAAITRVVSRIP